MKTKNIFVKLLVSLLIILTFANFIGSINVNMNYSFATAEGEEKTNSLLGKLVSKIGDAIVNAIKWLILAPFRAARSLNYNLASAGGVQGVSGTAKEITPFDIFFNKFTLLDANIFSTTDRDGNDLDPDSLVYKIRTNASVWYYALRSIAIAICGSGLLLNLFGALSKGSTAEKKEHAKEALVNWVLSFALVMFMHIIVIAALNFNDILLTGLESFTPYANSSDFYDALENSVFSTNLVLGIASLIVYALLNWQTLKYILVYIWRFLTIVFLVMISPLIPIRYSADKIKYGRGIILNGWLRELLYNIFVQVLHAVVYGALVGVSLSALNSQNSIVEIADLSNALVAIAGMLFIKYAERMVKTIFGFNNSFMLNKNIFTDTANFVSNVSRNVAGGTLSGMPIPTVTFGSNIANTIGQGMGNAANNNNGRISDRIRSIGQSASNNLNSAYSRLGGVVGRDLNIR